MTKERILKKRSTDKRLKVRYFSSPALVIMKGLHQIIGEKDNIIEHLNKEIENKIPSADYYNLVEEVKRYELMVEALFLLITSLN